jgi:hypothetical protein
MLDIAMTHHRMTSRKGIIERGDQDLPVISSEYGLDGFIKWLVLSAASAWPYEIAL